MGAAVGRQPALIGKRTNAALAIFLVALGLNIPVTIQIIQSNMIFQWDVWIEESKGWSRLGVAATYRQ